MPSKEEDQTKKMSAQAAAGEQPKAEETKLSGAELKKKQKAEKQARRAAEKGQQEGGGDAPAATNGVSNGAKAQKQGEGTVQQQKQKGQQPQKKQGKPEAQESEPHHKRTPSQQQSFPIRSKEPPTTSQKVSTTQKAPKKDIKQVQLLSHLYTGPRRHTLDGASKDIHPAVLALGLQISSYEICGSSARCVAMLLAFKECIAAYTTPAGTSLARHLVGHYLSPQIEYLKSCRPISESMGNAIRWLKKLIVAIDPSTPETEAKNDLCERIDTFIHERITITDQAIATSACQQIRPGSVVLTFAKSAIIEKTILEAHAKGTSFRVMVVDSRPLFEGKHLATTLMHASLEVEYLPYSALSHAVKSATLVLLGAHSMLSNGRLQSRIGTAALAMQAAKADIPVIVCCESVKFSGKVALDSIVLNEIAPEEELLLHSSKVLTPPPPAPKSGEADGEVSKVKGLRDFRDIANLQILNLMYDVTPAEYIRMVICEYGSLPPSSVPVVHRLANEGM